MKQLSVLLISALLSVVLFSCKPEPPEKQPDPTDSGPTDTSQISKNLLSTIVRKQDYVEDTSVIVRDAAGHIQKIIYRSRDSGKFPDPKLDSVTYSVFYNTSTSAYTHKVLQYKSYRVNFKDSSAYSYDAQHRLVKEEAFYFDYQKTQSYLPYAKRDLIYDASGNVASLKTIYYKIDGVNDYPYEITYTYDDKGVNLLNLGEEAVLLGLEENFSAHTLKTVVSTYPQDPQYNRSLTYKYTYNTKYRPLKAAVSDAVTGKQSTLVYTYK
jgi:hypothetical protein